MELHNASLGPENKQTYKNMWKAQQRCLFPEIMNQLIKMVNRPYCEEFS